MRKKALFVFALAVASIGVAGCTASSTSQTGTSSVDVIEGADEEDTTQASSEEVSQEETTQAQEETEAASEEETTAEEVVAVSPEEAQAMLMSVMGETEEETGNIYSYDYIENVQVNGVTYLVFEWTVTEEENVSKISDLFVTADGKSVYQGTYSGPDSSDVYLDNKMN